MFRRRQHQGGGDGLVQQQKQEPQQQQRRRRRSEDDEVLPAAGATNLWEADVATLEEVGKLFTDVPPHWRFINHTTGETIALRLMRKDKDGVLYLREIAGPKLMRVCKEWLAISKDPEEKWDMTRTGLRVRWGANIWEGSFNEEGTVWSSTTGYVKKCENYTWREVLGTGKTFTFIEVRRESPGRVYLFDSARHLTVRMTPTQLEFAVSVVDDEWQVIKRGHWTDDGEGALTQQRLNQMCASAWSVDDVCEFFTSLSLCACTPKVRALHIDGITLVRLDDRDLEEELGIRSRIVRKKVLANIARSITTASVDHAAQAPGAATTSLQLTHHAEQGPSKPQSVAKAAMPSADDKAGDKGTGELVPDDAGLTSHASRVAASRASAQADGGSDDVDDKMGKKGTIFLSYTWKYQDRVAGVRDELERAGFVTWMDIQQLSGGDNLLAQIDRGIRSSDVVVSFVSSEYSKSDYCRKEVMLAENLRKPILCVLVEPAPRIPWPPTGPMGPVFAGALYTEYFEDKAMAAVVTAVRDRVKQAQAASKA